MKKTGNGRLAEYNTADVPKRNSGRRGACAEVRSRRDASRRGLLRFLLILTAVVILVPAAVILLWSFTGKWPWPHILPKTWTGRTYRELLFGSSPLQGLLGSSILLGAIVALLATVIAAMTARATEIYHVPGSRLIRGAEFLPMVVPGTVFAMGFQVTLIRMGLNDTLTGVVLVHLVCGLPYAYAIMTDMTATVGNALEEQAAVLGAPAGRAFIDVTLPQLVPGLLSSFCMSFIISYSQYFTTLLAGGGKIKTIALVLVPYIQSGDRALSSVYSVVFVGSALLVFAVFERALKRVNRNLSC